MPVAGHDEVDRRHVLAAHPLRQEADLPDVVAAFAVSMISTMPASSADTQSSRPSGDSAKRRGRVPTRMSLTTLRGRDVDDVHEARRLGGDEGKAPVRRDQHAFRLGPVAKWAFTCAGLEIDHGRFRIVLVRDVEIAAVRVQVERLRIGDVAEALDQLVRRHVVERDGVVARRSRR